MMHWYKVQGMGEDYLAIDQDHLSLPLTPPAVRLLCDRRHGLGAEGVLVRSADRHADFGLRTLRSDGTEVDDPLDRIWIFAGYLHARGAVELGTRFTVAGDGEPVVAEVLSSAPDGVAVVEVEMGAVSFRSSELGLAGPDRAVEGALLELPGGDRVAITMAGVAGPHCICFEDELVEEDLERRAPQIADHPWLHRGAHVHFAHPLGTAAIEVVSWDRGGGRRLATATGACAVAAAAVRRGLVQQHSIEVRMPGGTFEIRITDEGRAILRAPVEAVYRATLSPGLLRRLQEAS